MIADIFITTKGRYELFKKSLESFGKCTDPTQYRLTVIDDGGTHAPWLVPGVNQGASIDQLIWHRENMGLGPSINEALSAIETQRAWDLERRPQEAAMFPFIVYLQDDLLYSSGWLPKLAKMFMLYEKSHKIAFASGIECIEHKEGLQEIGNGLQVKKYIRAACMMARRQTWMDMHPIPAFDPETKQWRAKPNDGIGSGVDWHFMRNHVLSVERTGKQCLVMPGLLQHMGYKESTWLKRELPESDSDKDKIRSQIIPMCKCGFEPCRPECHAGWSPT